METFVKVIPDTIREASKSVLGVISLLVLMLTGISYVFFYEAHESMRVYVFWSVLGFFLFVLTTLRDSMRQEQSLHSQVFGFLRMLTCSVVAMISFFTILSFVGYILWFLGILLAASVQPY